MKASGLEKREDKVIPVALILALISGRAVAQDPLPAFDVASVKPNVSGEANGGSQVLPGGRFVATNAPVMLLLVAAYRMPASLIVDGPGWIRTQRYDVNAKAEDVPDAGIPLMMQRLLRERFKLVAHRERREIPIYNLLFDRSDRRLGPRLTPSAADCDDPGTRRRQLPTGSPACGFTTSIGRLAGGAISIDLLASMLSTAVGRPVINRTQNDGVFDVAFEWSAFDDPLSDSGPIVTAIREQLGLKLEPARGSFEVLVIDSIERPTPD